MFELKLANTMAIVADERESGAEGSVVAREKKEGNGYF